MLRSLASTALRFLDFSGTASRREYWTYISVTLFCVLALTIVAEILTPGRPMRGAVVAATALLAVPYPALTVRRLHDVGRNGGWVWLNVFSYIGFLVLLIFTLRRSRDETASWPRRKIHVIGQCAVLLLAVLGLSRATWEPYYIPTGSMKPTLLVGDYIAVPLWDNTFQRGDVVVVLHPVSEQAFVARAIGLAGDVVQMQDGQIILGEDSQAPRTLQQIANGEFIEMYERQGPWQNLPLCQEKARQKGSICTKSKLTENFLDNRSYSVLSVFENGRLDTTDPVTVPPNNLFLLGDNRDNSSDSRVAPQIGGLGFVPTGNVVGRVDRVVFSSSGRFLWDVTSWRGDRFWKRIN